MKCLWKVGGGGGDMYPYDPIELKYCVSVASLGAIEPIKCESFVDLLQYQPWLKIPGFMQSCYSHAIPKPETLIQKVI